MYLINKLPGRDGGPRQGAKDLIGFYDSLLSNLDSLLLPYHPMFLARMRLACAFLTFFETI